jgi:hypothetical protein
MNLEGSNLQDKPFPSSTVVSSSKNAIAIEQQTLPQENKKANTRTTQLKICRFCELNECLLHEGLTANNEEEEARP